jgi:hypothetical protein
VPLSRNVNDTSTRSPSKNARGKSRGIKTEKLESTNVTSRGNINYTSLNYSRLFREEGSMGSLGSVESGSVERD